MEETSLREHLDLPLVEDPLGLGAKQAFKENVLRLVNPAVTRPLGLVRLQRVVVFVVVRVLRTTIN